MDNQYQQRLEHLRDTNRLESELLAWRMVVKLLCFVHLDYPYHDYMTPEEVARMMDEQRRQQAANAQKPVS